MLEQLTKKQFVENIIKENSKVLDDYMKKKNITSKTMHEEIEDILYLLKYENIHLEQRDEGAFKIKDVLEYLPVKLGYFKIWNISGEADNPERVIGQCPIIPTEKGKEIYSKYKRFNSN
jgi:hypothetical protein